MSKKQMSEAAKAAIRKLQKARSSILECDHLIKQVEAVVAQSGYVAPDGRAPHIDFFDNWHPRCISVAVFDADPASVIEGLAGPLFQHFGKPWKMDTMEQYKFTLRARLGEINGFAVDLVVQVISPTGCTFKTVTKEVQEIDCTA